VKPVLEVALILVRLARAAAKLDQLHPQRLSPALRIAFAVRDLLRQSHPRLRQGEPQGLVVILYRQRHRHAFLGRTFDDPQLFDDPECCPWRLSPNQRNTPQMQTDKYGAETIMTW
jgi:hypothetical protein